MENLELTQEWDKVFPKSNKVDHQKITFHNRYGITLAADMYTPKNAAGKLSAIAVSGPFGAVKEQSSGLYAQTMAEFGFLTIAFDPSFTGESGGSPRYVASPDINTEDFCAAVDFLSVQENVDSDRIGIIGICGWGGMAVNAAAMDTRIKATAAMTMYDMARVNANGYFDSENTADARYAKKQAMNIQRTEDYKNGVYAKTTITVKAGDRTDIRFATEGSYESPVERMTLKLVSKKKGALWASVDGQQLPQYIVRDGWEAAESGWYYNLPDRTIWVKFAKPAKKDFTVTVSTEKFDLIGMAED